ncbi:flagellar hook-length control protein FliK [Thiorhodococcus fuscus]|uniref:Flagellar hook-length control protein FliK n=1 Tax=Thiorhodococcus fuscus TaxID=527200 RepID=A0ABW4YAW4_9GAMM
MNPPIPPTITTAKGIASSTTGATQPSRTELPDTITIGARLEIQLAGQLSSGMTNVRVRLTDANDGWSKPIQARILDTAPHENRAAGSAARPSTNRLVADVVSVTPALVLKLPTNPSTRTEGIASHPNIGTPQWLDAQLRHHLPQSQPLAKTLETWLTKQAQVQIQTHTQPVTASPPSVTRLFESILEGLARPADLTDPSRLSKAIAGAGIWLEATLARTALDPEESKNIEHDLKARLLLVANRLRHANLDARSLGVQPSLDTNRAGNTPTENRDNQAVSRNQNPAGHSTLTKEAATTQAQRPFEENLFQALTRNALEIIKQAITQKPNTQGRPGYTPPQLSQSTSSNPTGTSVDPEIDQKLAPERQITLETKGTKNESLDNGSDQARPATGNRSAALGPSESAENTNKRIPSARQENLAERLPVNEADPTPKARHPFDEHLSRSLARDVDGMIKQVVTQQLQSLDRDPQEPRWVLELPLRMEDRVMAIQADIRRKKGKSREQEPGWDMKLRLDLQKLGPLNIHLHLRGGRLNASLNSENRQGAEILQRHLEQLRTQLKERELDVGSLHASYRPEATTDPVRDSGSPLLDDHA